MERRIEEYVWNMTKKKKVYFENSMARNIGNLWLHITTTKFSNLIGFQLLFVIRQRNWIVRIIKWGIIEHSKEFFFPYA